MDIVSKEVERNIKEYFRENLPRYEVLEIRKKSYHPDDAHLYMVSAKKMMVHMAFGLDGMIRQDHLITDIMT